MADQVSLTAGPDAAAARIRETAKWLTASLGAIAAILVTGIQLTSFGSLPVDWSGRFGVAAASVAIAAAGIGVVFWAYVRVAAAKVTSFSNVPKAVEQLGGPEIFDQSTTAAGLQAQYTRAFTDRHAAYDAYLLDAKNATPDPSKLAEFQFRDSEVVRLSGVVQRMLATAAYFNLAKLWKSSGFIAGVGAVLVIAGTAGYAWSTNPPAKAKASTAAPAVLAKAEAGTVTLNDLGQAAVQAPAEMNCGRSVAVEKLADVDAGVDVVISANDCPHIRFVLTPQWGSFSPQ